MLPAVVRGDVAMTRRLVARRADTRAENRRGLLPLMLAVALEARAQGFRGFR